MPSMTPKALRVPGVLESLEPVAQYVMDVAEAVGLDKKVAYRLRLAVDEIATNIVVHGYDEAQREGDLEFEAEADDDTLTLSIYDTGATYDPREAPEPDLTLPPEDRPIGGLGVFLAIRSVDELLYERIGKRNRTTFKVRLTGSAPNGT